MRSLLFRGASLALFLLIVSCGGGAPDEGARAPAWPLAAPVDAAIASIPGTASDFLVTRGSDGTVTVTRALDQSTQLVAQGVKTIRFSDEIVSFDVSGNPGQAYRLYQAAFNRVPDLAGLGFQVNALDAGFRVTDIAANFIESPEFQQRYGGLDDAQFVAQVYRNVLHREPDAGGLAFHVTNLKSGLPRNYLLVQFSESPENMGSVAVAIRNGIHYLPLPVNAIGQGRFIDAVLLKTFSAADITAALAADGDAAFLATPKYAVQAWRVKYLTLDADGKQIVASGLVAVPQKGATAISPVISYQHATIKKNIDAPTSLNKTGDPPVVLASLGYIVQASDYVGYGVSQGTPHPYLISAPSAAAVLDFNVAAKYWRQTQQVLDNRQLFMTGYSEGGYMTVAAYRALQKAAAPQMNELVHVVTGGGPYDVLATLDALLAIMKHDYYGLGYLFDPGLLKYLGDTDRRNARDLMMSLLVGSDADVVISPAIIDLFLKDDRTAIYNLGNVMNDWAPQVQLDLFHGRDDRTVPYVSATNTLTGFRLKGATDKVTLTDCVASPAGHKECVLPYWRFVLDKFGKDAKDL